MSIALAAMVENLAKRVATLEQMLATARAEPRRGRSNADRQADGNRLRAAIEGILSAHPEYTAKHVLRALSSADLGRQSLPSVRAVQWHVKALRNTPCALRSPQIQQG